jgi:hypothetical protein
MGGVRNLMHGISRPNARYIQGNELPQTTRNDRSRLFPVIAVNGGYDHRYTVSQYIPGLRLGGRPRRGQQWGSLF